MARLNDCPLCAEEAVETGEVVLRLVVVGDPIRMGAWCETCALPGVGVFSVRLACRHGWPSGPTSTTAWCGDHHGFVSVPAD